MRYGFSVFRKYVWWDMFHKPKYFWGMWGFKQTCRFIIGDSWRSIKRKLKRGLDRLKGGA